MLNRIRLNLARSKEFPEGSAHHGYEFVAPLSDDGRIDAEAFEAEPDKCTVRRFWDDEADEVGHLVKGETGWAFRYDVAGEEDDEETGFRFDQHVFRTGEYVSVREHDGVLRTFQVISVRPA
jgi:hypothetical protein